EVDSLGGILFKHDGKDAVPGADDRAKNETGILATAGEHAAEQDADDLEELEEDEELEIVPELLALLAGDSQQGACEQETQPIKQTLGEDQSNQDTAPGGLLPARPQSPCRRIKLAHRSRRPTTRTRPDGLEETGAALTNHRHG